MNTSVTHYCLGPYAMLVRMAPFTAVRQSSFGDKSVGVDICPTTSTTLVEYSSMIRARSYGYVQVVYSHSSVLRSASYPSYLLPPTWYHSCVR